MYGALNRLEEAVNQAGKAAKYQYNGLGHRVGKLEGSLPAARTEQMEEHLNPQSRIKAETEIGNWSRISYTIDLTREYHNLLERSEGDSIQTYYWDGNVASYEENGQRSYYLQDELGSPLRIEDAAGLTRESYGYGAFGEDLYGNQGEIQPFGYTGYQKDGVAGTYYAQAREYQALSGSFTGQDKIMGFVESPFTLNRYGYCFNNPMNLVDLNGAWPQWIEDIGNGIKNVGEWIEGGVSDVTRWLNDNIWSKYIYGKETILYERDINGNEYQVISHEGGNIIVSKWGRENEFKGWEINAKVTLPGNITVGSVLSGESWNPLTWKFSQGTDIEYKSFTYQFGWFFDKKGIGINSTVGGNSGNMPLPLPDGTEIKDYANIAWSYSTDIHIANWKQVLETISLIAAIGVLVVLVADDFTGVGVADNGAIGPVAAYIMKVAPSVYQSFVNLFSKLAACGG
ncbi:MAG TPA: RHS repeat-associated core domain-containing protein [Candidatus Mediterraneibacter pullistercoris]|nr:RHS repeat-associated core domain-containing protein [Candidatus Mediterraneibacter pullistercoris]